MAVIVMPTGEWAPDSPDYGSTGITIAQNVLPLTQSSYGPLASLVTTGIDALPSAPLGLVAFSDRNGSDHIFCGTATKLYRLSTGDATWQDVSNPDRTYSASDFAPWSVTAFANSVIFTNGADPIQIYDFDQSATTFVDLAADTAPLASFIATTGNFVITANVTEGGDSIKYPYRVHWGVDGVAEGAPYVWPTPGTDDAAETQSDFNDLRSDLGAITGLVAGLQNALFVIFLENGVYWCTYQTAPITFSFTLSQGAVGSRYRGSITSNRGIAYYLGQDGYYAMDGSNISPIGAQKVDRWFFADANPTYLYNIQAATDPAGKYVYWSYASTSSTDGSHDSLLLYNWSLSRFSYARVSLEWLARSLSRGYSLDELDQFYSSIDDPAMPSLDSPIWQGGAPMFVGFNADRVMCTFTGPNLAAVVETQEAEPSQQFQSGSGFRARVTEARLLIDGALDDDHTPTVAIGSRSRLHDAVAFGSDIAVGWDGTSKHRVDSRYVRARVVIPAGGSWVHFLGCELQAGLSTRR